MCACVQVEGVFGKKEKKIGHKSSTQKEKLKYYDMLLRNIKYSVSLMMECCWYSVICFSFQSVHVLISIIECRV